MPYRTDLESVDRMLDGLYASRRVYDELKAVSVSVGSPDDARELDTVVYRCLELLIERLFECFLLATKIDQDYESPRIIRLKADVQERLSLDGETFEFMRRVKNTVSHRPSGLAPHTIAASVTDPVLETIAGNVDDAISMLEDVRVNLDETSVEWL